MTGLGGLPLPKRPDQQRNYPPAGVQPGSQSGIIRAREVIISGTSAGILVYSPSPGAGNLVASMSAGILTDPYGNAVLDFQWASYNFGGGQALGMQNNAIQAYKLVGGLWVFSGVAISFSTSLDDLNLRATGSVYSGDQTGFSQGISGLPETVHQFTSGFPAGFTGTVSYWLDNEGVTPRVGMDFHITIANGTVVANNTDLLNAVGSSYHFTDNKFVFGQINGGGLAGNQFAPMRISSTGELFYGGPAFTAAGNAFFYGGSTYSVAV